MEIKVKIIPVKTHNSIGIIEYYYSPVQCVYLIISIEIQDISKDITLQIAFKAINNTTGPDSLVLTLLVYSVLSQMIEYDTLLPSIIQHSATLKKTISEIQKLQTKRLVIKALSTRNGPNITDIHDLVFNSDILVWRKGNTGQSGSWEGPYKLVTVNDKNYILELPYNNITFCLISVKLFYIPDTESVNTKYYKPEYNTETDNIIIINTSRSTNTPKCNRGQLHKVPNINIFLQDIIFLQDEFQYE
jgi:hypothetical protein